MLQVRRIILQLLCCTLLLYSSINSHAQLQKIDSTFMIGTAANGAVRNIDIQSHGKIIITGEFTNFNGTIKNRIARLNPNGTTDQLFETGVGAQGPIRATALQKDDKLIIAGLFSTYNGGPVGNLARLNENAVIDSSFHTEIGANNEITEVFVQHDGKVLIAGFFSKYNNINNKGFIRLNTDGSIDTTFNIGNGPNISPNVIYQKNNNKLLIGGSFVSFNAQPVSKIIQLNLDGSLDTTFKAGLINGSITGILYDSVRSMIYISGSFTNIDNNTANRIARLYSNGKHDTTFKASINGTIRKMHLQKNNKLVVSGDFTSANGIAVKRMALFQYDGSLDNNQFVGTNGTIYDITEDNNRNILMAGAFTESYNSMSNNGIATKGISRIENTYCISATAPIVDTHYLNVCKGDSFVVNIISGELNDDTQWYWYKDSFNGSLVDSGKTLVAIADTSTTYYVRSSNSCNVLFVPHDHFHITVPDSVSAKITKTDKQLSVPLQPTAVYQWYFCDSTLIPIQGENGHSITPTTSANYLVDIFYEWCYKRSECVFFPVVISGIEERKDINIINPIYNEILIGEQYSINEIKIISMLGETVFVEKSNNKLKNVNVENLPNGFYLVLLKSATGEFYQKRVLKNTP